jgi:hypothetical protein
MTPSVPDHARSERTIDGVLFAYWETGTEGVFWAVLGDEPVPASRENLHILTDGDELTVFDEDGSVLWRGVIHLEYESNWIEYPGHPGAGWGQQAVSGYWVHGVQRGVPPETWGDWYWGHEMADPAVRDGIRKAPLRARLVMRRDRASPTDRAVRAFVRIAQLWELTEAQQLTLLGTSLSRATITGWQTEETSETALSLNAMARISYLVSVYEGLQRFFRRAPKEADRWVRRPRPEAPFNGATPLQLMLDQGIPGLDAVRRYVDAAAGGPPSGS